MWRLFPVLLVLSSCALPQPRAAAAPLYATPAGSVLVLTQDLEIPAGSARVYLQGGGVRAFSEIDPWYPHCWLLSRLVNEVPQVVRADRFRIVRVGHGTEQSARRATGLVRVSGSDGGPPAYNFATLLELESPRQAQVMRLECTVKSDYAQGEFVDLAQFARAVGAVMYIDPAGRV